VIYIVRDGDNLYRIGLATGASATQLRLANCLLSDQIFPGQRLYVPYLPTDTATPSNTPDSQGVFHRPSICVGSPNYAYLYVAISITVLNLPGVNSVTAVIISNSMEIPMIERSGGVYYGMQVGSVGTSPNNTASYYFIAKDNLGNTIARSIDYSTSVETCPTQTTTTTSIP
jgi:LysM repeat protein